MSTDRYTRTEAAKLARELLNAHGLGHVAFQFNRAKRALGVARFKRGEPFALELSEPWLAHLTRAEVEETVRHEIAHLLCPADEGHGRQWKATARKVGAAPDRCATIPRHVSRRMHSAKAKWVGTCPVDGCNVEVFKYRMGRAMKQGRSVCAKHRKPFEWKRNR